MRTRTALYGLALVTLVLLQGCAATTDNTISSATPPPELEAANRDVLAAWRGQDPEAVARLFANDAIVIVPDRDFRGVAAIRGDWVAAVLPTISNFDAVPEYFAISGNAIAEVGHYSFDQTSQGAQPRRLTGVYTTTWRRQADGTWRIQRLVVE